MLILAQGTRGDVQPFIALTRALTRSGHHVCLGAPEWAAEKAKEDGAECIQFCDVESELMSDPAVREGFETNYHGIRGKYLILKVIRRHRLIMPQILSDLASCVRNDFDMVVFHATLPGHEIAERMGVPAVPVCLEPWYVPTSAFPTTILPVRGIPSLLNRATYVLSRIWLRALRGDTTAWREGTLNLPRRSGHRNELKRPDGTRPTVLQPISRHVLPSLTAYPDWLHTTGFWFLPASYGWQPPPELEEFLSNGDPPVYIGFGSVVGHNPRDKATIVAEAVRIAGVRAVIGGGQERATTVSPDRKILYIDDVPFDWLFHRVAAIVHHGGSGTIGLAAASGRPQVVCPAVYSQPFNARRMHSLGVAPRPQNQRNLTSRGLAQAIECSVTEKSMLEHAIELSQKINSEDGIAESVRILETILP